MLSLQYLCSQLSENCPEKQSSFLVGVHYHSPNKFQSWCRKGKDALQKPFGTEIRHWAYLPEKQEKQQLKHVSCDVCMAMIDHTCGLLNCNIGWTYKSFTTHRAHQPESPSPSPSPPFLGSHGYLPPVCLYLSMVLQSFVGPCPLFQFLNPIHSR
jgi:hypothetical protein